MVNILLYRPTHYFNLVTYLMLDVMSYYYVHSLGYLISQYDVITDMAKDS